MKKLISILLVLVLCLSFSGCVNGKDKIIENHSFYTLLEAYNRELLSDKDLIEIADYYQGEALNSLSINLLDKEIKKQIVKCYLLNIIKDTNVSSEYVEIYAYYGTYNSVVAIGITDTYSVYDKLIIPEYKVGDIIFYNYAESDIMIWIK